ncbi:MAG: glycosyltransferase [Bacteroidia bacterium]|nr:glycosyltransferase [Bacteroidia bacterium]
MSLKLFTISSMYPGNLGSFYKRFNGLKNLSYDEHYNLLLNDTTEFVGSYTKTFRKLGIDAKCVIASDFILQNKWRSENCNKSGNDKKVLFEQVKRFQPEILSIENLSYTDKEWLENIRESVKSIKLIIAHHSSPIGPKIIERLQYVDFVITCTPGLKQDMENKGFRSYLVYHGFDKELLSRINQDNIFPQNNLIFSGSLSPGAGFHGDRIDLVENILKADLDIALYVNLEKRYKIIAKQSINLVNEFLKKIKMTRLRNYIPLLQYEETSIRNYSDTLLEKKQQPVFGIDMYNLFKNSKIVLNFHIGVAGNYAGNMRLFEVTGVGSCLLTDNKANLSDLFIPGKEVVVYDSMEDCIEKAKWLLDNEDERVKIARAGQQKTLISHTVENRCSLILKIIDNELNNKKINKI